MSFRVLFFATRTAWGCVWQDWWVGWSLMQFMVNQRRLAGNRKHFLTGRCSVGVQV